MAINEVFVNPTVKKVIFQIQFPNLFYIEQNIGDLQQRIMSEFPESALLYQNKIMYVDMGPEVKLEDIADKVNQGKGQKKIWQFKSKKGIVLNVLNDSLDITSNLHKTYNNKNVNRS